MTAGQPLRPATAALTAASAALLVLSGPAGCTPGDAARREAAVQEAEAAFEKTVRTVRQQTDARVLEVPEGGSVLVSPGLQGRILTARVGTVASAAWIDLASIGDLEREAAFHNHGGADRFWLGPETGPYGLYFAPGDPQDRAHWTVPEDFDRGAFEVVASTDLQVSMRRDMEVRNASGTVFRVRVQREAGVVPRAGAAGELGTAIPEGVAYAGAYSDNVLTNLEDRTWERSTGLVGIWVLGQFQAGERTAIIAPIHAGDADELGPEMNDRYFDDVSEESPERIAVIDGATPATRAVVFRADARRVGKFGLGPKRTLGVAGAYDFERDLLVVVRFDVAEDDALYGDSTWMGEADDPYAGDAFQSFVNGVAEHPGQRAEAAFFELESASPLVPLAGGESLRHRHATYWFRGDRSALARIAREVLQVDLSAAAGAVGI